MKNNLAKLEGRREAVHSSILKEYDVKTEGEARTLLEEMEINVKSLEKKLKKKAEKLKPLMGDDYDDD